MERLTHISLFTGIGGIDLAAEWAGFETVLMVENNAYCQKVLKKHWPDVPILEDIFNVNKETIQEAMANTKSRESGQQEAGDRGEDISGGSEECSGRAAISIPSITLITGGFPCQPVSNAGKRKGKADDRWLWPEMLRIISEVRPTWVVAENVDGLKSMVEWDSLLKVDDKEYTEEEVAESGLSVGEIRERRGRGSLEEILESLEAEGYKVKPFLIPACSVNAPHRRDRIFIVAHSEGSNVRQSEIKSRDNKRKDTEADRVGLRVESGRPSEDVAGTNTEGPQRREVLREGGGERLVGKGSLGYSSIKGLPDWAGGEMGQPGTLTEFERPSGREIERNFCGISHGISRRVDRLRCLGNAVVPQQIYPVLKAIADMEV